MLTNNVMKNMLVEQKLNVKKKKKLLMLIGKMFMKNLILIKLVNINFLNLLFVK